MIFGCSDEYLQKKKFNAVLTHSYAFLLKFTTKDRKMVIVLQLAADVGLRGDNSEKWLVQPSHMIKQAVLAV